MILNLQRVLTAGLRSRPFSGCGSAKVKETTEVARKLVPAKPGALEPMQEPAEGFDKCLQRAAGILVNLSERNMMKVLHVHCGGRLGYYLGQSSVFDITGVSPSSKDVEEAKSQRQYKSVSLVDGHFRSLSEDFRSSAFQAVVCLHPPHALTCSAPSIQELLRLVTDDGFALVGAREEAWEADGLMEEVNAAEAGAGGLMGHSASLLSMQIIDTGDASYMMALIRKK